MQKMLLDKNAAFRACQKDRHYIEKLETELRNCYQEIGIFLCFYSLYLLLVRAIVNTMT